MPVESAVGLIPSRFGAPDVRMNGPSTLRRDRSVGCPFRRDVRVSLFCTTSGLSSLTFVYMRYHLKEYHSYTHVCPPCPSSFFKISASFPSIGPNPQECGPTPYGVVPNECQFIDQQTLKLQEAPESVPTGEMPRSILLSVERNLVDKAPPGTRVNVIGIASLFSNAAGGGGGKGGGGSNGSVRTMYLRVTGLQKDSGTGSSATFTPR